MSAAFPRKVRLTDSKSFKAVFQDAKRIGTPQLLLLYRPNGLGYSRVGLAISKKNVKSAVNRNRAKRLIREFFRQRNTLTKSCDMVLLSRSMLAESSNEQIRQSLEKLWAKLKKQCAD